MNRLEKSREDFSLPASSQWREGRIRVKGKPKEEHKTNPWNFSLCFGLTSDAGGVQGRGRSQPAQCWTVPLASRQIHHPVIHPEMGKTAELSYDRRVGSFELLKITAREAK